MRNLVTGDEKISFTLPVADKPKLDDEFYQADGRYTAEGIAKGFSPAVVSIEVYKIRVDMLRQVRAAVL